MRSADNGDGTFRNPVLHAPAASDDFAGPVLGAQLHITGAPA
jgi:hypothetical protein